MADEAGGKGQEYRFARRGVEVLAAPTARFQKALTQEVRKQAQI